MKDGMISWVRGAQDVRTNGKTVSNSIYVVAPKTILSFESTFERP